MHWIKVLKRLLMLLRFGLEEISSWTALVVTLLVTADVSLRYVFRESIPAATEFTQAAMVIMVFLAFGKSQANKEHIRVKFLIDKLPPKVKPYWEGFVYLLALVFISILFWGSLESFRTSFADMEFYPGILRVPVYPSRAGIVVGCGLMMIEFIKDIIFVLTPKGKEVVLSQASPLGDEIEK